MIDAKDLQLIIVNWVANPLRGEKFEEAWLPAAEAVTKFGAHAWGFMRSQDDPIHFMQVAVFDSKLDWERYWYSEEIAEARVKAAGYYQLPLLPVRWQSLGFGVVSDSIEQENGAAENGEAEAA